MNFQNGIQYLRQKKKSKSIFIQNIIGWFSRLIQNVEPFQIQKVTLHEFISQPNFLSVIRNKFESQQDPGPGCFVMHTSSLAAK